MQVLDRDASAREIAAKPELLNGLLQDILQGEGRLKIARRHGLPLWRVDDFAMRCAGLIETAKVVGIEQARLAALSRFEEKPTEKETGTVIQRAGKVIEVVSPHQADRSDSGRPLVNINVLGELFRQTTKAGTSNKGGFNG